MLPSSFFYRPNKGRNLHGLLWRAKNANANHPPIICVHGLTRSSWDFSHFADKASAGHKIIALDMAGRGGSPQLADAKNYNYFTYVWDCIAYLEKHFPDGVNWLGTSMGGLIGMMIAAQKPALIKKLVLNDIGPFIPLSALKRIAEYVGADRNFTGMADALRYCKATYADFGIKDEAAWRHFTLSTVRTENDNLRLQYDVRIAEAFAALTSDVNLWPLYEKVKCPTLVLRGLRSDVLRAGDAEKMTQTGPKAALINIADCGHASALIDDAQINAVTDFFGN